MISLNWQRNCQQGEMKPVEALHVTHFAGDNTSLWFEEGDNNSAMELNDVSTKDSQNQKRSTHQDTRIRLSRMQQQIDSYTAHMRACKQQPLD
jgi:hypothetical protein